MRLIACHRLAWLLSLTACSGQGGRAPAPVPLSTVNLPSSPADGSSGRDPRQVSVLLKLPPAGLTIDGKLDEWGSLAPLAEQISAEPEHWSKQPYGNTIWKPDSEAEPESEPEPESQSPALPAPTSRLALALEDALWVAADLDKSARNGVWLGIGAAVPPLPPVGFPGASGYLVPLDCEYELVCCNDGNIERGPALAPKDAQVCREKLARHAAFTLAYGPRFQRMYRVDRRGAFIREADGRLTPIAGAKVALVSHPGGARLEASLPLAALPLFSQAPLSTLRFVARALSDEEAASDADGGGDVPPKAWVWLSFPEPIAFEPNAELRELAYTSTDAETFFHPCLAYQAADPERMEFVRHDPDLTVLVRREEPIYRKLNTLGDVEVGALEVPVRRLLIRKPGQPLALVQLRKEVSALDKAPPLKVRFAAERNGDLHYLAFVPAYYDVMAGPVSGGWWLTIVHPDGSYEEDVLDVSVGWGSQDVTELANADFSQVGIRGLAPEPPYNGFEVTATWDAAKKKYVTRRRALPKPRPKKAGQ